MLNIYPYTDAHELNLDWFLAEFKKVVAEVNTLDETVKQFTNFVTNYFDNLDVQEEINKKLNAMVADGTMARLIQPLFDTFEVDVNTSIDMQNDRITTLEGRMDAFSTLAEGSTTGDAELMDARVAYDGVTYPNAGDAIRAQVATLTEDIGQAADIKEIILTADSGVAVANDIGGAVDYANPVTRSDMACAVVSCSPGDVFTINGEGGNTYRAFAFVDNTGYCLYTIKPKGIGDTVTINDFVVVAPPNAAYLIVNNLYGNNFKSFYGKVIKEQVKDNDNYNQTQIDRDYDYFYPPMMPGSLTLTGNYALSAVRITHQNFIDLKDYDFISLKVDAGYRAYFQFYSTPNPEAVVGALGWYAEDTLVDVKDRYLRIVCASVGDATPLSAADYNLHFKIGALYKNAVIDNNIKESFTPQASSGQGTNKGINLRVLSYNVAAYNNDTTVFINDEQVRQFKMMLNKIDADFAGIQEDAAYINSDNDKASDDYLYLPKYPQKFGSSGPVTHHKINAVDGAGLNLKYSNGRYLRFATFQLDASTKLLFISTHPVYNYNSTGGTSPESIAARLTQYTEMFDWIAGNITLEDVNTSTQISVPTFTHCIICIDANSVTASDKSNLAGLAAANNFILGNGGALGWFKTEMRLNLAIDNIIVSDNIIINNIEALSELYTKLYSDHVPLFADVTLI